MLRMVKKQKYEVVFVSARLPSHYRGVIGELKGNSEAVCTPQIRPATHNLNRKHPFWLVLARHSDSPGIGK
jgi:hypothetical protein